MEYEHNCPDCGSDDTYICAKCRKLACRECYQRYEMRTDPKLCYLCQSAADREWMQSGFRKPRRTT